MGVEMEWGVRGTEGRDSVGWGGTGVLIKYCDGCCMLFCVYNYKCFQEIFCFKDFYKK